MPSWCITLFQPDEDGLDDSALSSSDLRLDGGAVALDVRHATSCHGVGAAGTERDHTDASIEQAGGNLFLIIF